MAKRGMFPKKIFGISSTLVVLILAGVAYMKNWGGLKDKLGNLFHKKA